jgi:hypothetical protein
MFIVTFWLLNESVSILLFINISFFPEGKLFVEHCLVEGGDGGDESAHIACTIFVLYLFYVFGVF